MSKINWQPYITRPFTLFGASLWQSWYGSEEMKKIFGVNLPRGLFIEEQKGMLRCYRPANDFAKYNKTVRQLILKNPDKILKLLNHGLKLNKQAQKLLKHPPKKPNLKSLVDFHIHQALHSTVIPFICLKIIDQKKIKNPELIAALKKMRGVSLYPRIIEELIKPAAIKKFGGEVDRLTISEVLNNKKIDSRPKNINYSYQVINGKEKIIWTKEPLKLISQIESLPNLKNIKELKGQPAYLGKAKGHARLVLTENPKGIKFNKGDILVSVTSSPSLMPLLTKCGGIVTDEGGISCHAAVVSRELKKPCLTGTKYATLIIKDGDQLELNANKGIVTIL